MLSAPKTMSDAKKIDAGAMAAKASASRIAPTIQASVNCISEFAPCVSTTGIPTTSNGRIP
jgi:hypothetical protein